VRIIIARFVGYSVTLFQQQRCCNSNNT